jgi:hypothetical protein
MAVTFNNKDARVWNALLGACCASGFRLETVTPLKRSAPNITEIHAPQAPKLDLVLLYQKSETGRTTVPPKFQDLCR